MAPNPNRALSPVSDKYKLPASLPTSPASSVVASKVECDYDKNPTVLYEAIEAKQWEYAINLFAKDDVGDQASTWVVRKETNGKLRWRILPLHAAVIFGSPVKLVECLLEEYPEAARCKDDQGMLPLHLCFRNESTWDIADELLTSYPQAIFVSDRKGRTPLQCAIQMVSSSQSVSSIDPNRPESKAFRNVVNVLDMYSQIAVSAERRKAQHDGRKAVEQRIAKLQDTHLSTLNNLKREWHTQREEAKRKATALTTENQKLQETVKAQGAKLKESANTEAQLRDEIRKLNLALSHKQNTQKLANKAAAAAPVQPQSQSQIDSLNRTNEVLRKMIQNMVGQQKSYHAQFTDLMGKYEKLVDERTQLEKLFVTKTQTQHKKESMVINNFKQWMNEREKSLDDQSVGSSQMEEEKKNEDLVDFTQRPTPTKIAPRPLPPSIATSPRAPSLASPRPASIATSAAIIDLSNMASPRDS